MGYFGTNYYKEKKEEEDKKAPIKEEDLPLSIRVQKMYQREMCKQKTAEEKWFNKLEQELDRFEVEDNLVKYREKQATERKQMKLTSPQPRASRKALEPSSSEVDAIVEDNYDMTMVKKCLLNLNKINHKREQQQYQEAE